MTGIHEWELNLQAFGEGGDGAGDGGAAATPAAQAGEEALSAVKGEQVLEDGTRVDPRLAERMEKQRKRHPERKLTRSANAAAEGQAADPQTDQLEQEWQAAKKSRFAAQYGRDVQAAVQERFKNQQDLQGKLTEAEQRLESLNPMLNALMSKAGVDSVEELSKAILDDDSLYEEDAEAAGMTVEAYKSFKKLQDEVNVTRQREAEAKQQAEIQNHLRGLAQQGEKLKATFPEFDLMKELQDPVFRRLTAPNSGLSVEQAYYAVHHAELAPRAMQAGIQRAQQQISQSIQANAQRPTEGAMQATEPAQIGMDPRRLSREERRRINEQVRMGKKIVF